MVKQVSVTEAHDLQQDGHVYVDVRSSAEFAAGHPAGAYNVPLLESGPFGRLAPNPDFLRVIAGLFASDAKLLMGCQVGGRSQRAAEILLSHGFTDVANVRGGFAGARDPMSGRVVDPGWVESGLPVEDGQPDDRSYRTLSNRAGNQA